MLRSYWVRTAARIYHWWRDPVQRVALLAGMAALSCLLLMAGPPYFSTASVPQRWSWAPEIEVQTVRDLEDLRLTLGDAPSQDREAMRIKVRIDFAFIAAYVASLVALGVVLARRGAWRRVAGAALALAALAMGVFDVLENFAILDILDVRIAVTTETMLDAIRQASTYKWSLAAVCAVLLLSFYEPSSRSEISGPVR